MKARPTMTISTSSRRARLTLTPQLGREPVHIGFGHLRERHAGQGGVAQFEHQRRQAIDLGLRIQGHIAFFFEGAQVSQGRGLGHAGCFSQMAKARIAQPREGADEVEPAAQRFIENDHGCVTLAKTESSFHLMKRDFTSESSQERFRFKTGNGKIRQVRDARFAT